MYEPNKQTEDMLRKLVKEEVARVVDEKLKDYATKDDLDKKASEALGIAIGSNL